MVSSEAEIGNFLGNDNVSKDCWKRLSELMRAQFGPCSANAVPPKEVFKVLSSSSAIAAPVNNHLQYEFVRTGEEGDEGEESKSTAANDPSGLAHSEAEVDAMRAQKDVQLNLYVQEMAMKEQLNAKLNQPSAAASGSASAGAAAVSEGADKRRKVPREPRDNASEPRESRDRARDGDSRESRTRERDRSEDRGSRESSREARK
jgi:hypothetical protein